MAPSRGVDCGNHCLQQPIRCCSRSWGRRGGLSQAGCSFPGQDRNQLGRVDFGNGQRPFRLPSAELKGAVVIQGLGGLADPNDEVHAADLTRRLAKALNGQAFLLSAPAIAASCNSRDVFYKDQFTAESMERARQANLAFMGIGAPRPDSLLVKEGSIVSWPMLAELMSKGAVGDINLRYFDSQGQKVNSDLDTRVVGLTLDEVRQIELVVGVAGGSAKYKAIEAALRGGLVDVLVTDHITAQELLKLKQ